MLQVTVSVSCSQPGVHNRGVDFTVLFASLGLILATLGLTEMTGVPITHVDGGVYNTTFKVGSPIIPYLIGITMIPIVLDGNIRGKYAAILAIMSMLLLADLTAGYVYTLLLSIMLWVALFFFRRSLLRLNRVLLYSALLASAYACLVGLHILTSPVNPLESPLLGGFTEVLWRAYSVLRWPAIILYTLLPYTLLLPLASTLIGFRNPILHSDGYFKREIFSVRACHLILASSICLAAYLAVYNYLPKVNPHGYASGVDTVYYYAPSLRSMLSSTNPITFAFSEPFSSTRPFYMLFLYAIQRLTGLDGLQTAKSAPVILLPLLVASYYLLAHRLFKLKSMGALAALLTLAGIQVSVGIFTSYQANFLGLVVANLLTVLALTVERRRVAYPLLSMLAFSLMLIHSWTSLQYVAILSITLFYRAMKSRDFESLVRMFMIVFFTILSASFVNIVQQPVEGSTDPLHAAQTTLIPMFSLENLRDYWVNTYSLFTQWFRGFMGNAFLYLLAIIGIMRVRGIPEPAKTFLTVFTLTLLPLPLVNYVLGSRLYFNQPLQLYASLAMYPMLQDKVSGSRIVAVLLCCFALVYSIIAVAKTGFIPIEA
ncbi:MAG: hypothetical protein JTT13_10485 [Candidatus Brockarchaeota archaeon]|nr:hypothetical protein [Candidatus Brockarchaeota archaeon]